MCPGAVAGFKYFDCRGVKRIAVRTRGGVRGRLLIRTAWDGEVIGSIELGWNNEWKTYSAELAVPDGVHALYFEFEGYGRLSFAGFELMSV